MELESTRYMEEFMVKHCQSDERPIIKGNGFDGLEIGEDRAEAEKFVSYVNKLIRACKPSIAELNELTTQPANTEGRCHFCRYLTATLKARYCPNCGRDLRR